MRFTASQIIERLRPEIATVAGAKLFLSPAQDITVGGRLQRGSFQYTLRDANIAELVHWSQKMLERMRALPEIADAATDLLANAPQLEITINRDQAVAIWHYSTRRSTTRSMMHTASGRSRNTSPSSTPIRSSLRFRRSCRTILDSLDRIYVKSPLTGAAVPLVALGRRTSGVGPLSVTHQGQFPAVTLSFNLRPGVALGPGRRCHHRAASDIGMPGTCDWHVPGQCPGVPDIIVEQPVLIVGGGDCRLHHPRDALRELHPPAHDPLDVAFGRRRRAAGADLGHMDLSVIGIIGIILLIGIVKKNGIMLVDFAIVAERERL